MYKRWFTFFIVLLNSVTCTSYLFACSLPPDIIHEFRLDVVPGKNLEIHYSLAAWGNLDREIQKEIEAIGGIDAYLRVELLKKSTIEINGVPIRVEFLSGGIADNSHIEKNLYAATQTTLYSGVYSTSIPSSALKESIIDLKFKKTLFQGITPLIHPYIFTNIQKDGTEGSYVIGNDNQQYFHYTHLGTSYNIRNNLKEGETENIFTLIIVPSDKMGTITGSNTVNEPKLKYNGFLTIFSQVGNTLEIFFYEKGNTYVRNVGLLLALILGMGHGLLPGHSKSLIATFIVSKNTVSPSQILLLIGSSAFSHTFFLFILATLVIVLEKGLSHMAGYIITLSAIGYICFGFYFMKRGREMLTHLKHHIRGNILCHCDDNQPQKRSILTSGMLAGMNPCIDALALFLLAMSMGDGLYALMMILAFSLGLGLMLGLLAYIISRGKSWLSKKSERTSEKFSAYTTFYSGLMIIILGSYTLLM